MEDRNDDAVPAQLESLLKRRSFAEEERRYEPEHFGNYFVTFVSRWMRLRLVRDRGQLSIDVAEPALSSDWHNLNAVLEFVGPANETPPSVEAQIALLTTEFDPVANALSSEDLRNFESAGHQAFSSDYLDSA